ncbi:hypothetical protein MaudCBS49596_001636 [Microsporum audouinii]
MADVSCHCINLGSTIHEEYNHNTQLVISSSVQVSQADDSILFLGEGISVEHLLRRDFWVSWSSNSTLRLKISVRMQASSTRNSSMPVILRQVLDILTRSAIWSALGLHVTLNNEEMVLHNETNVLNINLQAQPNKAQVASYGLNKFPRSLGILLSGNSFIRPPPEIPTIQVREVGILLDFSGASSSVTSAVVPEDKYTYSIHSDVPLFDSDGWESLDNSSPFSSQESNSTHSSVNSNSGSPASETQPSNWSENNSIWPFIPLLNAGLRTLLRMPLPKHRLINNQSSNEHQISLAKLSPSIFSPGYNLVSSAPLMAQK